ncbi:unnamed protein product, partial [Rotaria sp. Silwood2]
ESHHRVGFVVSDYGTVLTIAAVLHAGQDSNCRDFYRSYTQALLQNATVLMQGN